MHQLRARLYDFAIRQTPHPTLEWEKRSEFVENSEVIPAFVREIHYDGPTGTVWVKLRSSEQAQDPILAITFEYSIPSRRGRALPVFRNQSPNESLTRPPRVARLVALAHKLEELVQSGKVKDYAELARLTRVSPARIGQIVILGQLAPAIQEQVLFLPADQAGLIPERALREIAREPRWDRQRSSFERLLAARS